MFDQPLATIVAAVLALAGTLVGVLAASRRWRRERREARGSRFFEERHEIYKVLWDRVEQVNVALRRARVDEGGFVTLVADLNEYMLRNGAHVDDADRTLVNQYIRAVKRVHAAVASAGAEAKGSYEATDTIPREVLEQAEELGSAQAGADRLREELRTRVRAVLTGTAD